MAPLPTSGTLTEVTRDVFLASGTASNWILLRDGDEVTLIDGGYPGDLAIVEDSLRRVGSSPQEVRAMLLTHAHIDHIGAAPWLVRQHGTAVYTDPVEVPHAHRDYLEQLSPGRLAANLWRPGVLPWTLRILRAGATESVSIPSAQAFPAPGALDLPGRPVPVATHGHTAGHTAYHLPAAGVVITGDGLITGHDVSRRRGPQLAAPVFEADPSAAQAALTPLESLDADVVLPGHGPAHHGPIVDAVVTARRRP